MRSGSSKSDKSMEDKILAIHAILRPCGLRTKRSLNQGLRFGVKALLCAYASVMKRVGRLFRHDLVITSL